MKVLVLGASSRMGPYVVRSLEERHTLRLAARSSAIEGTSHERMRVDISDLDQVVAAAEGMDAIVNLSVMRSDPRIAFDVNMRGCYNVMTAAVEHGIRRVVNTVPHLAYSGASYERFDFGICPDVPPQPGTCLYGLTKSLGQEISRLFTEKHDIYVVTLAIYHLDHPEEAPVGIREFTFNVTWEDSGEVFRPALEVEDSKLPSRCETFNVLADTPYGQFSNEKTKRILGWQAKNNLEHRWRKPGG